MKYLRGNTSAEDITVALQEIDYDFINVKQITAKRLTPEGGVTHATFPLFLVTVARTQETRDIFKLTRCNTVIKIEPYISQNELTQCYYFQRFGHIWVHCRQTSRCMWCGGGHRHHECPETKNFSILLQLRPARRRIAASSKIQRPKSHKKGITAQKEHASDKTGVRKDNILFEIHNTRSIICRCCRKPRSPASAVITIKAATVFRKKNTHQDTIKTSC
jgi:hypothetical protein